MILKRIGTILVMLWAARGVLLLMGAIMAFARGMLPLTPDAVQNVFVTLFIHLGIPCILLYFLLRDRKQRSGKSSAVPRKPTQPE